MGVADLAQHQVEVTIAVEVYQFGAVVPPQLASVAVRLEVFVHLVGRREPA